MRLEIELDDETTVQMLEAVSRMQSVPLERTIETLLVFQLLSWGIKHDSLPPTLPWKIFIVNTGLVVELREKKDGEA
jgi:hypothetical protein